MWGGGKRVLECTLGYKYLALSFFSSLLCRKWWWWGWRVGALPTRMFTFSRCILFCRGLAFTALLLGGGMLIYGAVILLELVSVCFLSISCMCSHTVRSSMCACEVEVVICCVVLMVAKVAVLVNCTRAYASLSLLVVVQ